MNTYENKGNSLQSLGNSVPVLETSFEQQLSRFSKLNSEISSTLSRIAKISNKLDPTPETKENANPESPSNGLMMRLDCMLFIYSETVEMINQHLSRIESII